MSTRQSIIATDDILRDKMDELNGLINQNKQLLDGFVAACEDYGACAEDVATVCSFLAGLLMAAKEMP